MLQVREIRFHYANGLHGGSTHLHTFRRSIGCKNCILLAAMLLFHSCVFTHSINQGWQTCSTEESSSERKTPANRKTSLKCQYKNGKERKFYFTVIDAQQFVSFKFLYNFSVPDNLDSTLLKLCKLILPSVHFSRLHDGLILRTLLQRKKSQQHVGLHTEMGYTLIF